MLKIRRNQKSAKGLTLLLALIFMLGMLPQTVMAARDQNDPIITNRTEGWPKASEKDCDYVCLYDTSTDTVLINKGMDVQTPPASLTKIMTVLVALERGNLDDMVAMTQTGVDFAVSGSSNLYTVLGESFTLRDMLYGTLLASANDMATQVAEYIGGGSVDNFVAMMNERAKEIGCTGTNFVNACGMPADGHVSTAHDMALISAEAIKNDTFREMVSTVNYTIAATDIYAAREITNHHPSLASPDAYGFQGVIGGKTGYTDAAGNCLVTYVERDGRLIVCVTMHGDGIGACLQDTSEMITYAYVKWVLRNVKPKEGEELVAGGKVLTPKKKKIKNCDKNETVTDNGDGREKVENVYLWKGTEVGRATILRPKPTPVPTETPTPQPAAPETGAPQGTESTAGTGYGAFFGESGAENAQTGTAANALTTDKAQAAQAEEAPKVQLPFGITMNRAPFISIAVLALLILLGIILILLTIALRKK